MGNVKSQCLLSKLELQYFASTTVFSADEVKALWYHFMTISGSSDQITRVQFQAAMLFRDSALLDRIFRIFDANDDNMITFQEYISCLSVISSKAKQEEKLKFSYQLYDFDADGLISTGDLVCVLAATLREHDLVISRDHINEIVAITMKEANCATPGFISYVEYQTLVSQRPHLLAHLTMNISSIICEYTATLGISFATPRLNSNKSP